ncbi:alpha/beta fold hydrolase, partial [bacterium]|nr:alpha/beta fold hydrolase [bacterium]
MEWLRIIVFTVSALGVVPAAAYVVSRLFAIDRRADVMHYRATSDGWRIALHEFRPADGKKRKGAPVLMCHGLGGNHHIFDFAEGLSLARYLAGEGHHVFLLDLRGAGDSEKAPITDGRRFDWTLQTYLSRDLPTAVDAVLEITGAKTVHWVGHSMGG